MGKIWELADGGQPRLHSGIGRPAKRAKAQIPGGQRLCSLSGDELTAAIKDSISHKEADLKGAMASQGPLPRRLTDLIGSLCDLSSGSGDKGTPIIWIQGYFDNFAK
ncbi:MAG: coenzyme F420-0:L-glutamate ligase [Hydrogeniiclostridium mannosilyticum]